MHSACRSAVLLAALMTCALVLPSALAGGIPDHVGLKVKNVGGVCIHTKQGVAVETTDCAAGTSQCFREDLVCIFVIYVASGGHEQNLLP